jgi:hypothetical protein
VIKAASCLVSVNYSIYTFNILPFLLVLISIDIYAHSLWLSGSVSLASSAIFRLSNTAKRKIHLNNK